MPTLRRGSVDWEFRLKECIHERRQGSSVGKDDQQTEKQEHADHGNHPPELAFPEEGQQLAHNAEFGGYAFEISHKGPIGRYV